MKCTLIVFGREPELARVKTRLAEEIGERAALRLYEELLEHSIRTAAGVEARLMLFLAERRLPEWSPRRAIEVAIQCAGDLGKRLWDAFDGRFRAGDEQVVIIGSDCPSVKAYHLEEAFDRLHDHPIVIGPAHDGGYWLVGQRAPGVNLFSDIPWSTSRTLDATREKMSCLGVAWAELETLRDLDTAEDLAWHAAHGGAGMRGLVGLRKAIQDATEGQ